MPSKELLLYLTVVSFGLALCSQCRQLYRRFRRNERALRGLPGIRVFCHPHSIFAWLPRIPGFNIGDQYIWERKHKLFDKAPSDVLSLVSAFPWTRMLIVADPVAVQYITADRTTFQKPIHYYGALALYGMNVGVAEGEVWRRHRRIVASSFTDRTNANVWQETSRIVADCMTEWSENLAGRQIQIPSILDLTLKIGLFVLGATAFSYRPPWRDDLASALPEGHKLSLRSALNGVLEGAIIRSIAPKWLYRLPIRRLRHLQLCHDEYETYVEDLIQERSGTLHAQSDTAPRDLLQSLLEAQDHDGGENEPKGLSQVELLGNIYIFMLAGHETNAHTLAAALTILAVHQDFQQHLWEHIMAVVPSQGPIPLESWQQLTLVRAAFLETLRLYPTVVIIPKYSMTAASVPTASGEKVYLPPWTDIFIDAVALHRNPKFWGDDCNEYRPERFVDSEDGSYAWPRNAFMGFSAGHRACLGRQFALVESIAVLTFILRDFSVHLPPNLDSRPDGKPESLTQKLERVLKVHHHITLTPEHLPLVFRQRGKE